MIGMKTENKNLTASQINSLALEPQEFLDNCTKSYHNQVFDVAEKIFSEKSRKIIMLAGPSSSGKTTTALLMSKKIRSLGGTAYTVSLDDFYHPHSVGYPLDENGEKILIPYSGHAVRSLLTAASANCSEAADAACRGLIL